MSKKIKIAIFVVLLLAVDQVVKILVKTNMSLGESIHIFGDWFQICFAENEGAAFGMKLGGNYGKLFLSLFRIAAISVLCWYINHLIKRKAPKGVLVGFSLVLAGAIGNMIDSAFYGLIFSESTYASVATMFPEGGGYGKFLYGKVVDMLYFPVVDTVWPSWMPFVGGDRFVFFGPIFNIADSYITCSVVYLLLFKRKYFMSDVKKKA